MRETRVQRYPEEFEVVVPGCVDFFNQGAPDTLPERYRSRKSYFHNPVATLVRLTAEAEDELGRQVRIEGTVERVSDAEADEYFSSRPRESRLAAWASPQSQPIKSKGWLMARVAEMWLRHAAMPSRPPRRPTACARCARG